MQKKKRLESKCNICGKKFPNRMRLAVHRGKAHPGNRYWPF